MTRSESARRSIPRRAAILFSASGGMSLASLAGLQPLSDIGSPRLARASHLWAVCRPAPAIAAASETVAPERTRETRSSLPLGVSPALGRWDMGGPSSLGI